MISKTSPAGSNPSLKVSEQTSAQRSSSSKVNEKVQHHQFRGTVISDKMQQTIVVIVDRTKMNRKYKRQYRVSKKYKIHDPKEEANIGDQIIFEETRPISKGKRWKLIKIISKK